MGLYIYFMVKGGNPAKQLPGASGESVPALLHTHPSLIRSAPGPCFNKYLYYRYGGNGRLRVRIMMICPSSAGPLMSVMKSVYRPDGSWGVEPRAQMNRVVGIPDWRLFPW